MSTSTRWEKIENAVGFELLQSALSVTCYVNGRGRTLQVKQFVNSLKRRGLKAVQMNRSHNVAVCQLRDNPNEYWVSLG